MRQREGECKSWHVDVEFPGGTRTPQKRIAQHSPRLNIMTNALQGGGGSGGGNGGEGGSVKHCNMFVLLSHSLTL